MGLALALAAGACAAFRPGTEIVVEDAAGEPVPGALVSCGSASTAIGTGRTDRRGRISFVGTPRVDRCEVTRQGYRPSGAFEVPERAGRIRVTLHQAPEAVGDPGAEEQPPSPAP